MFLTDVECLSDERAALSIPRQRRRQKRWPPSRAGYILVDCILVGCILEPTESSGEEACTSCMVVERSRLACEWSLEGLSSGKSLVREKSSVHGTSLACELSSVRAKSSREETNMVERTRMAAQKNTAAQKCMAAQKNMVEATSKLVGQTRLVVADIPTWKGKEGRSSRKYVLAALACSQSSRCSRTMGRSSWLGLGLLRRQVVELRLQQVRWQGGMRRRAS